MRKCDVGGQAVIEGVMMRGSKGMATAIRTPKGKIKVSVKKTVSLLSFMKLKNNILWLQGETYYQIRLLKIGRASCRERV